MGHGLSAFQIMAVLIALVAAVGTLNARTLKLPQGVAMVLAGLIGALIVRALGQGAAPPLASATQMIGQVDFQQAVLGYLLAFLLFAGAMQVDFAELRRRRLAVLGLATAGVLVSTVIVGFGLYALAVMLGLSLSLPYAFVFATLISATDPVAVLAMVKHGSLSPRLTAVLQGEALFNDGVAIVAFSAMLSVATGLGAPHLDQSLLRVLVQAGGGLALGAAAGWVSVKSLKAVDDYPLEAAITLACAMGAYSLAEHFHLSGAIAAVAAGLVVGDQEPTEARRDLRAFWLLVDELLNALLFLLLGLQVLVLPFDLRQVWLWAAALPLVLLARLAAVAPWGAWFHLKEDERGASKILTWGGLRGALSLALALQMPEGPARDSVLGLTYAVVIFSVVVQGLSFAPLAARWSGNRLSQPPAAE
jgi:CPA1 family monovalent cation:H+ antiporter